MYTALLKKYKSLYGSTPTAAVKSPGRVNIIGEHTDYNDGLVLPFAIDKSIFVLGKPNKTQVLNCFAYNIDESISISIDKIEHENYDGWKKFVFLIIKLFQKESKQLEGLDIIFGGDLPIGAGVSSSSALTCGIIACINEICKLNLNKDQIVSYASMAENGTGVRGGKMDQNAIVHSIKDHALFLDCKNGKYEHINIATKSDHSWVILDTKVKHKLVESDYNLRRDQCDLALAKINTFQTTKLSFRALKLHHIDMLNEQVLKNRLSHYINENQRVINMLNALEKKDIAQITSLLNESHKSLSKLYEVSCVELDFIASSFHNLGYGARMMGGGFGGCVISYIPDFKIEELSNSINESYSKKFGFYPDVFVVKASQGLTIIKDHL